MANPTDADLLSRLMRKSGSADAADDGGDPWDAVAATAPAHEKTPSADAGEQDPKLADLLQRINRLTKAHGSSADPASAVAPAEAGAADRQEWVPREPPDLRAAGLSDSDVEALALKLLLSRGAVVGRDIASHLRLPFVLVEEVLRQLKREQLVLYRSSAEMNDFVYQLTEFGCERARRHAAHCSYFGAAPVALSDYIQSVQAQSMEKQHPTREDLQHAFQDLLINPEMLARLGPAVNSGRGLFLYGAPGNGKTSIAERVTRAFGRAIWIPRAISIDGEIMRLFDPMNHAEIPVEQSDGLLIESRIDRRWVCVRRPTIVVGGELMMDNLEVTLNTSTGISEAPVQLKSNCGTLVIDDFGRQRMSTDELLNRWIVPLEKRYDYLNMPNGKKIQVPFDQLIIFSTNLEPRDLVDDAFLRRIPYKIEVTDPSEDEFRELFRIMCRSLEIDYREDVIDYLLETHYRAVGRPLRCCQPRDLLLQVRSRCHYDRQKIELTPAAVDFAVENYFAVM